METLTDGVVTLVRWRSEHQDTQVAAVVGSLDHLAAWMPWAIDGYDEAKGKEFLARAAAQWESGEEYNYAIFTPDGELAGSCGLMRRDDGWEIGYWLAKSQTGKGYVTRASALLVSLAWQLDASHVLIKHDLRNVRSGAVPERLGFSRVGEEKAEPPLPSACSGVNVIWRLERPA
ncbi:N-acetyltransferase [Amycolatopsis sp. AA4]|uniref:GNAT family N-acetyltransferase n=1 Tax=Actinomycetes TaxID=1760 RepID=UPI0001B54FFE|nr:MULTISPECIES: GNAT family N-acetyltransferase [Actinomycetes]ATY11101.1 N-acetyltransferase [Amycolatopsis sp. AA4]